MSLQTVKQNSLFNVTVECKTKLTVYCHYRQQNKTHCPRLSAHPDYYPRLPLNSRSPRSLPLNAVQQCRKRVHQANGKSIKLAICLSHCGISLSCRSWCGLVPPCGRAVKAGPLGANVLLCFHNATQRQKWIYQASEGSIDPVAQQSS